MKNDGMNEQNVGDLKLAKIDEGFLRDKIYTIRGRRVMLDFDLAEIYGYTTKAFNQQVRNNAEKFEGEDFMFQLTRDEVEWLSRSNFLTLNNSAGVVRSNFLTSRESSTEPSRLVRCQNCTSRNESLFKGQDGGSRYLPHAFTEQGIYMLMTVLRGELAVKQSRALVMTFKAMKDYIINNYDLAGRVTKLDGEMQEVKKKLSSVVLKSELSPMLLDFKKMQKREEYIFAKGGLTKADEVYIGIYAQAESSIYIVDNYINIKTLRQLQKVKQSVKVTILSDNLGNYLHASDYRDFRRDYDWLKIDFVRNNGVMHDRFILIDINDENGKNYHCGASAKDAGDKFAAISELKDKNVKKVIGEIVINISSGEKLRLK